MSILEEDRTEPEPFLNAARSYRAIEVPEKAEAILREGIEEHPENRELWDLWLNTCFTELKHIPAQLLNDLPGKQQDDYAGDVAWLLQQLAAGTPIRMNCGGDDLLACGIR